ncbi:hypothetical protein [Thermococcus sp.]|uniref:hypothetical protein n=1 Tax=Thermococcus sp. TaxID=35749 RepID=UPI0026162F19|nr:hypothetical protein [Thermococcus sp.]
MKRIFDDTFKTLLFLFVLGLFTLSSGSATNILWNGTLWAIIDEENGNYYLTTISTNGYLTKVPLHLNGTPCGLVWNGSEWLVETFIPDSVVVQTLNGSVLFRLHSYDCSGFAYLNGTYYVPISESARMGDCSLVQVSGDGKIKGTVPCGFINGVRVKAVGAGLYLMNCTGIYIYSNGHFELIQRLENCAEDFDVLNDKILLCSNDFIEHSKNTTRKILTSCDAIGCNGRECLIVANGTLYSYDGGLRKFKIEKVVNPSSAFKKTIALSVFIAVLAGLLIWRRRSF